MFMYFWINYCDENHIERIPIAVKNIGRLFHLISETMEADTLHQGRIQGVDQGDWFPPPRLKFNF